MSPFCKSTNPKSPPFVKGDLGEFSAQTFPHCSEDDFHHFISAFQYLSAIEAQYIDSKVIHISIALRIFPEMIFFFVLRTVYFNDQVQPRGEEINNIVPDRLLSIKLNVQKLLASQAGPKDALTYRQVFAQVSCMFFQIGVVREYLPSH